MKIFPSVFTFFACFVKRWQWCDKTNTYWGLYTGCFWNFIHVHQFIVLLFTITLDLKHSSKICSSPQTYYLALSLNFIVLTPFPLKTNIPQMKNLWKRENYKISPRNKRDLGWRALPRRAGRALPRPREPPSTLPSDSARRGTEPVRRQLALRPRRVLPGRPGAALVPGEGA